MSKRRVRRSKPKPPPQAPAATAPSEDPLEILRARARKQAQELDALPDPAGFVGDDEGDVEEPYEPELIDLMKGWRHGRATRRLSEALSDGYVAVFSLLVVGAMLVNAVISAQRLVSACETAQCLSARALVPIATLLAALALALAVSRLFGPVVASAAEGFWLMSAPIRRGRLLGGRLVTVLVATFFGSAALSALLALASGSDWWSVGLWALGTGLGATAMVAIAAAEQGLDRRTPTRVAVAVFGAATVAVLLALVAQSVGWLHLGLTPDLTHRIGLAVAVGGFVALVVGVVFAWRRLNRIRRVRLTSGGALVAGLSGAMSALDLGLARDILIERAAIERGHVRSVRGGPTGRKVLTDRARKQLLRHPQRLIGVAVSVVVPHAISALGLPVLAPVVGALALFIALVPTLGELRVLTRTNGLARTLPLTTAQQRMALMIVPAVLAGIWAVLTVPAFADWGGVARGHNWFDAVQVAVLTAAAGLLGAVRWVVAKPINWNAPMVATASGALPSGMLTYVVRGVDMVVLITAPMVFGLPPVISFAIAVIVYIAMLGYFDIEKLQKKQAQQMELAQQAKSQARGGSSAPKPAPGANPQRRKKQRR
ncbi:MAG: ABC transporter permease [Propionibacterium sp.]|nr:ABC transporter permease [Propionibacterium sp.]